MTRFLSPLALPALALALLPLPLLLAAPLAPALAFTVEAAPTNIDGSPRFADPDEQLDRLSDQLQSSDSGRAGFGLSAPSHGVFQPFGADSDLLPLRRR